MPTYVCVGVCLWQVARAEEFLKRRIPIGSTTKVGGVDKKKKKMMIHCPPIACHLSAEATHTQCSSAPTLTPPRSHPPPAQQTSRIQEEATGQGYSHPAIVRAISILVRRGDLLERDQGRVLKRIR